MSWKYALASVAGAARLQKSLPCADHSYCATISTKEEILIVAVSDGAGSATCGEMGSAIACRLFVNEIGLFFCQGGTIPGITREFAGRWLLKLQLEIQARAEADSAAARDYACTFLGGVIAPECAVFIQVGDGAMVIDSGAGKDEYHPVFWPQHGEYANQTIFVTDQIALASFHHLVLDQAINEIAAFTDGLERMVLDFRNSQAHSPFFEAMFKPLRKAGPGHSDALSGSLASFLDSPKITEQSADDKTLILATRLS